MDREYEFFYIVRPDLEEEAVRTAMDELGASIVEHGGEVGKASLWGRRRLAYPIAGFSDGYYVVKEIKYPAEKIRELERQLVLDERVIRHLITLKQVYYLPGTEDGKGRSKGRRGREAVEAGDDPGAAQSADSSDVEAAEEPAEASDQDAAAEQRPEAEAEVESEAPAVDLDEESQDATEPTGEEG